MNRDTTQRKRAGKGIRILSRFPGENPNPILRVGLEGVIRYANKASEPLLAMWNTEIGQAMPDEWRMGIAETFESGQRKEIEVKCGPRVFSCVLAPELSARCVDVYATDITERKQAEAELADRLRFGTLLAGLLARFVNVPAERLDDAIEDAQRGVGECLGVEASSLWQASAETPRSVLRLTHVYRPLGGPPLPERIDAREYFPWCYQQIVDLKAKVIAVSSLDELPAEAARDREAWRQLGVKSALVIALSVGGGTPVGVLSFNTMGAERTWSEEIVNRLQLVAEMLSDALARQDSDRALRESEERYRTLFENAPVGIYRSTPDGQLLVANPRFVRMLGYSSFEELAASDLNIETCHREYARTRFQELAERPRGVTGLESKWRRRDGSIIYILENARVVRDDSGKVLYYEGTVEDITERKRAEEALAASEQRYRELFENALDIVFTCDLQGNFTSLNRAGEQISGYTRAELTRMNVLQILAPKYAEEGRRVLEGLAAGREPGIGEWEIVVKDGHRVWLEASLRLVRRNGEPAEVQGIARDITERKRAKEALEQAAKRFKLVTLATQDAVFDWDLVSHEIWRNENYQRLFGAPERSLDGDNWWHDRLHLEDRECVLTAQDAALGGEGNLFSSEFRLRRPDGSYADIVQRSLIVRDGTGQAVRMMGALTDISERKRAEEALRESEARFRTVFENAAIGIALVDMHGRPVESNPAVQKMLGHSKTELAQMTFSEFTHPDDVDESWDRFAELVEGKRDRYQLEKRYKRKDGRVVWGQLTESLVRNQNGDPEYAIAMVEDISERKRAEGQVREYLAQLHALAARLHSVREEERARVAREVHDELGQNLTAIKIDLTSIFRKLGENARPFSGATESILKLVDETIRTVRRIATELRPGILDDLGLTAAIEWAMEEFQARTGIKCQMELQEEHMVLDRQRTTAIFRIFQETLTNVARHSGATQLHVRLFRQNANTILEVQDNGVGIQPQHLTSPASLGISGMRERALVLNGQFEIAGHPGKGTKVSVRIPDLSPSL